jgi:hypothetical protein
MNFLKIMPLVRIYGLPPHNLDNTLVEIFDNRTYGSSGAIRLYRGNPDNNGQVICKIPKEYIGSKIRLVALPEKYIEISDIIEVSKLGVFHVTTLEPETFSNVRGPFPVEPKTWYLKALKEMKTDYRNAKYKNYISKSIYWLLTLGAPIVGLFLGGYLGLLFGLFITLCTVLLGKYASGDIKGI